jgi:NADH:ubiquinone oxidoreductase subunit E
MCNISVEVEKIVDQWGRKGDLLVEILHDVQAKFNYLPQEALEKVSELLEVPAPQVYYAATFYNAFSVKPRGKHCIGVCMGTPCHVRGAPLVLQALERHLGIKEGETDEEGRFTLLTTGCVGTCGIAPVVCVDDEMYGNVTQANVPKMLKPYEEEPLESEPKHEEVA